MFTFGVAGHVDHGKTVLVTELTGTDTDRLEEEKRRGMSIDIGFASTTLPSGDKVSFIDVPGHEKFIKNMLAGATGIDALLLVVAADDGVMPQTREHLLIAKLLGIGAVLGVVSKTDVVDESRVDAVVSQVNGLMSEAGLADVPVVPVSAARRTGLDNLLAKLSEIASAIAPTDPDLPLRMPVDRVFAIKGAGTIVTGTLWEGSVAVGDRVELHPGGRIARLRSLQVHGEAVGRASGRGRLAMNLVGVDKSDIGRGAVVLAPGVYDSMEAIDALVTLLPDAPGLRAGANLRFFHGTAQCGARLVLDGARKLEPGGSSVCRLRLGERLVVAPLDRFVLRRPGGSGTIGGGVVVDPWPPYVGGIPSLAEADELVAGRPELCVEAWLRRSGGVLSVGELASRLRIGEARVPVVAETTERVALVGNDLYARRESLVKWKSEVVAFLEGAGAGDSYYRGTPAEEIVARCFPGMAADKAKRIVDYLVESGKLARSAAGLALPDRSEVSESPKAGLLLNVIREDPYAPPSVDALATAAAMPNKETRALLARLRDGGELVEISGFFFDPAAAARAEELLRSYLGEHGSITVSEFRQLLGTSRKYALPLLEYFDRKHVTKRQGDSRVAGRG